MIQTLKRFSRLLHIGTIMARHRLDELSESGRLNRRLGLLKFFAPFQRRRFKDSPRGERLRLTLQDLGPVFVKFGQILSTRRDLLPRDIADELALLQDRVPPFPGEQSRSIVEQALGGSVDLLFKSFETTPLASASIAQVHAAQLIDGRDVVVKVVRPAIEKDLRRDIDLLKYLAGLAEKYWADGKRIRPKDIVREFETVVFDELDMQREAANAAMLRRNFADSKDLYIPEVYWPFCKQRVMVMERVSGLPVGDIKGLKQAGVNLERLAVRGIRVFYTQVFRDNLFHADMHPGNILVDATEPDDPTFIAMDFGIVASLTPTDLHYISENFIALFNQQYRRVAQLHVDAGWVPADTRVDEMEAAVRTVGESAFARPLNEISFGEVLVNLFRVAHRFKLTIQPQLIMLQKTLLNIEGLGRELYPDLDIWAVAKPELEAIIREQQGLDKTARELRDRLPGWLAQAPEMPGLIHNYLTMATRGQLSTRLESATLDKIHTDLKASRRTTLHGLFAGTLAIAGSLLIGLDVGPWRTGGFSSIGLITATMAAWMAIRLWRNTR